MIGAACLTALALTGCAQAPETEPTETTESIEPVSADMDYCERFMDTSQDYLDAITGVTQVPAEIDVPAWHALSVKLDGLDPSGLGKTWVQDHGDYMSMKYQIDEIVDAGGGAVTFTTDTYKAGNIALMEQCVGAGYNAGS